MARSGHGRIYCRPDGKYFIYVPVQVAKDTAFPLKISNDKKSEVVKVEFNDSSVIVTKA